MVKPEIIVKPTPYITLPIDPKPTRLYATYGETVGDGETASYGTGEITLSDDYADIKGSTIWRDTLATSGLGFTAEEIRFLELSDEELLTLGLTDEELLALRLQNEVYSMKNTSDVKASDDTDGDDTRSARASVTITMDDEQEDRTESELVTCYTYDSFDRLLRYSDHDGSTCYSYNADGYRTAKYDYDDSAEGTRYLSIGGRNLFETSCAGSFTALNTYGTTLTSRASLAGGYEYRNIVYLYSAYGDVVLVADAQTGVKLASYAYDPFGNVILTGTQDMSGEASGQTDGTVEASIDNPYGYRGYVKDDESGLYYLNARYYDSASGRFLTADTFRGSKDDPLSLNRYVYCQSNPVRYTDPSGHYKNEYRATIESYFRIATGDTFGIVTDWVESKIEEKIERVSEPYYFGGMMWEVSNDVFFGLPDMLRILNNDNPTFMYTTGFKNGMEDGKAVFAALNLISILSGGSGQETGFGCNQQVVLQTTNGQYVVVNANTAAAFEGYSSISAEGLFIALQSGASIDQIFKMQESKSGGHSRDGKSDTEKKSTSDATGGSNSDTKSSSIGVNANNEKSSVGAEKYSEYQWYENEINATQKSGRSKNKISPNSNATGNHVVYKKDPVTGEIVNYKVYKVNPQNPTGFDEVIGYDGIGTPHTNKVTGERLLPHVHDSTVPGGVRAPYLNEIPYLK